MQQQQVQMQKMDEDAKTRAALDKKRKGKRRIRAETETAPLTFCLGKRPSDPRYQDIDVRVITLSSMTFSKRDAAKTYVYLS